MNELIWSVVDNAVNYKLEYLIIVEMQQRNSV
jgi:hypothetical protein